MNKDKHVRPDVDETLRDRIEREAESQRKRQPVKIIYGPDNEPLAEVNVKRGR